MYKCYTQSHLRGKVIFLANYRIVLYMLSEHVALLLCFFSMLFTIQYHNMCLQQVVFRICAARRLPIVCGVATDVQALLLAYI